MRNRLLAISTVAILSTAVASAQSADTRAAPAVRFTVDATRNVKPISRYIYGINSELSGPLAHLTFRRMGGNRWSAYNWENNASNAGSDYIFQNDNYLGGGNTPGGAVIPAIQNARSRDAGLLLTIPINGYVAADKKGNGDVHDSGPNYLNTRFRKDRPEKGAAFALSPDKTDKFVYQDEFVNWVKTNYPSSQAAGSDRPIWFSLDNEPDLWASTHAEVHPGAVTYAELIKKTIDYAAGIKAVAPHTLVFGPASYGFTGYVNLQNAPDANGRYFLRTYLQKLRQAETDHGKRLLDVLDLHWYPEARGDGARITGEETSPGAVAARIQAPRSLWDTTYKETSWIADDYYGGPIYLLPRLFTTIRQAYQGTRLAFSEYNYGGGQHISGGIAQADVLGIFGRDGVFAANQWPLHDDESFVAGGFRMFRDFNGSGGAFGDTSVFAQTDNVPDTSVYASLDSGNAHRMVVVAINKTSQSVRATIVLKHAPHVTSGQVYQLTGNSSAPKHKGSVTVPSSGKFSYLMPPMSVSTLNLTQ
jgi:hypothetical protein